MSDYDDLVFGRDSSAGENEEKLVEILGDGMQGWGRRRRKRHHHHRQQTQSTPASTTTPAPSWPTVPPGWPPPPYPAPPEWPANVPYPPPGAFGTTAAPATYPPTYAPTTYPSTYAPTAYPSTYPPPVTPPAPAGPAPTIDVFVGACLRRGVPAAAVVGCLRKRGYTGKQISDAMGRCL